MEKRFFIVTRADNGRYYESDLMDEQTALKSYRAKSRKLEKVAKETVHRNPKYTSEFTEVIGTDEVKKGAILRMVRESTHKELNGEGFVWYTKTTTLYERLDY